MQPFIRISVQRYNALADIGSLLGALEILLAEYKVKPVSWRHSRGIGIFRAAYLTRYCRLLQIQRS
jgi:hypothetical protein